MKKSKNMKSTKWLQWGKPGFTLIELLIIIAILGVLAAVIIPNTTGFLSTGTLSAAKNELQNVKTAAMAYLGEHEVWPNSSTDLASLIVGAPKATYVFDNVTGFVIDASGSWSGITWSGTIRPVYPGRELDEIMVATTDSNHPIPTDNFSMVANHQNQPMTGRKFGARRT
jgi:prepilin-type N-terminal cleavage/methylation domain-containing protein